MSGVRDMEYYQALIAKDPTYLGTFYVGVSTTGVFCHVTCPARKPKFENCTFFQVPQQALEAGFRPCKRCHPLLNPHQAEPALLHLMEAVDANPERAWHSDDIEAFYIDPSTVRRQFKKRFAMTFVEYVRARRLGLALKLIKGGVPVIEAQIAAGYGSGSGFREAFVQLVGKAPAFAAHYQVLETACVDTPLGTMRVIADEQVLYLLEFTDRIHLDREIDYLRRHIQAVLVPGYPAPILQIEAELSAYFAGRSRQFRTPIHLLGTPFQQRVWTLLQTIPYGETRSYSGLAQYMEYPTGARAVAQANAANRLAIIIPCHRVIQSDGNLAGYGGGVTRKRWLIDHEQSGA